MDVLIRGGGVAAFSCAFLLRAAGLPVNLESVGRRRLPTVVLPESSQTLIQDVLLQNRVFRNLPRIRRRVVKWGAGAEPAVLPHSAAVVSEQHLLEHLQSDFSTGFMPDPDWTIACAPPFPENSTEHEFGSRRAEVAQVQTRAGFDSTACFIESLPEGWLFLIPDSQSSGWLISVGASHESNLQWSKLIASQVERIGTDATELPSYPSILWPLSGPNWLACGSSALRFDPLCGDGTGHAIREAILAAAILRAATNGADVNDLLVHYRTRLLAGFQRHLSVCRGFYESGGAGPWWSSELAALERGIQWCEAALAGAPPFRYRLNGLELEPVC